MGQAAQLTREMNMTVDIMSWWYAERGPNGTLRCFSHGAEGRGLSGAACLPAVNALKGPHCQGLIASAVVIPAVIN